MTTTLCTSGSVKLKAGVDHTALTFAQYEELINQAEGAIIADTRINWVDIYSTMNDDFKKILEGATAAKAAVGVINYDPLALGGLGISTTMINVNLDEYDRAVKQLKEQNVYSPFGGITITT